MMEKPKYVEKQLENIVQFCDENEIMNDDYVYIDQEFEDIYGKSLSPEISLCMLGGINLGNLNGVDTFHRMEKPLYYVVKALDKVIDIQDYPVPASAKQIKRRSIGVGVTNFAYFLAKNNLKYGEQQTLEVVDELFEHIQFYLMKASMELAKELGPCEYFHKTKYSDGLLPIDLYNKNVDQLVNRPLTCDWEWLRGEIKKYGLRNSVLSAIMPSESCAGKETKIVLSNGSVKSYEEIFIEQFGSMDIIENNEPRWIDFKTPFDVRTMDGNETVTRFWYNGVKEVYDIEMEDGTIYKMTANHKLLINRNGEQVWIRCDEMVEGDDVVNINE